MIIYIISYSSCDTSQIQNQQKFNIQYPSELEQFDLLIKKCRDNIFILNQRQFTQPLCKLIHCTMQPFIQLKSFQEIRYYNEIINHLQLLTELLDAKTSLITVAVCKVELLYYTARLQLLQLCKLFL